MPEQPVTAFALNAGTGGAEASKTLISSKAISEVKLFPVIPLNRIFIISPVHGAKFTTPCDHWFPWFPTIAGITSLIHPP